MTILYSFQILNGKLKCTIMNRIVQLGGNRKVKCENVFVSLGVSVSVLTKGTTKWQTSHPSGACANVSAFESAGFTHHQLVAHEGVLGVIKNN